METLPPEMVEQIVRYLPAQDLATCSAVSRSWRETFNQDWVWKPRCDPSLEESLRTTTCVVKPAFETPQVDNSTLTPICKWKLAFMREKHLWRNWKHKNVWIEKIPKSDYLTCISFLTNTLFVSLSERRKVIEIWDVSVVPANLVASTSIGRITGRSGNCTFTTVGNRWIIVHKPNDVIDVYFVNITQKLIKFIHDIRCPEEGVACLCTNQTCFFTKQKSVDGRFFLLTARGSDLIIRDLEKREPIKRVCCPVIENQHVNKVIGISDIPKSDDILVFIENKHDCKVWSEGTVLPYIYSLKQQLYLPGPISEALTAWKHTAINDHYVCFFIAHFLTIVDYHTSEVLLKIESLNVSQGVLAFNDSFVFVDGLDEKLCLKIISIKSRSVTSIFEYVFLNPLPEYWRFDLIAVSNRFLILYCRLSYNWTPVGIFEPFGQSLKKLDAEFPKSDYFYCPLRTVNKACTRSFETSWASEPHTHYYW